MSNLERGATALDEARRKRAGMMLPKLERKTRLMLRTLVSIKPRL